MSTASQEINSKGKPVIVIWPGDGDAWAPLYLGASRAKAVLEHLEAIKEFILANENVGTVEPEPANPEN